MKENEHTEGNGLKLHMEEMGSASSPAAVFLHGFPEIWYSWWHQMIAVAKAGFRAIAPDFRGYGLSDLPPRPDQASFSDLLADLLALVDSLKLSKFFLIGKDFGSRIIYLFTLLHSERVHGIITPGIPFSPPSRCSSIVKHHSKGSYISRWQEHGRAKADFSLFDCKTVRTNCEVSNFHATTFDEARQCPTISESKSLNEEFDVSNLKVKVPALVITGGKDYSLKFPGIEEYIKSGKAKSYVLDYEIVFVPEGSHFMQEQFPHQINQLVFNFLRNHS